MTDAELTLREQAAKAEKLEIVSDVFNNYINSIKDKVVARLSGPLDPNELSEAHAVLICLKHLQDEFNSDMTAGKLANKELTEDV